MWGNLPFFFFILLFPLSLSAHLEGNKHSFPEAFKQACTRVGVQPGSCVLIVDIPTQTLTLWEKEEPVRVYMISTAARGIGSREGSWKTPLGLHRVCGKIGGKTPKYSIFQGRKYTGEIWSPSDIREEADLILSRILRLEGLERGVNTGVDERGYSVDSYSRYIYIHGTNHENSLGTPTSQGCVRMHSEDICQLFTDVPEGSLVWIKNRY